jgi:transposase
MSIAVEALFTSALGLKKPWVVTEVALNADKKRIDFEVSWDAKRMNCPVCNASDQRIHDRMKRSWRHLDFFEFEAWLHAEVPRVKCGSCGKTTQGEVPWARPDSGFTLLFEALALTLCQGLPVAQAARQLRTEAKRLWRAIDYYVAQARAKDDMAGVSVIGIDETSAKRGHEYVTVVHDLEAKRLLTIMPGRGHETVAVFKADLIAHGGDPDQIKHVCMDMGPAYIKGVTEQLPQAAISFDRFHVVALANEAMNEVRLDEVSKGAKEVRAALGGDKKALKAMRWGMLKNPIDWTKPQMNIMYMLQRSNLRSTRAWRLKEGLRAVYASAVAGNCPKHAENTLLGWLSWARRSRLEPFKRLAATIKDKLPGVVSGMLDGRSNAYVEAMNGLLQQTKIAARGFRSVQNFMTIAYLRMSKLKHLPENPFRPAAPRAPSGRIYRSGRQVPH